MINKQINTNWIDIDLEDLLSSRVRVKLLKVLVDKKEINISTLVKEAKSNHTEILKHVTFLKSIDLLEEKYFGRIHIVRFKEEKFLGKIIKEFFSFFK
ncbi:MAG: hypothetical protein ACFFCS_25360 [Candidatus Hodarchaeota archaeon]